MKYLVLLLVLAGGPSWHLLTAVRDRNVAVATAAAAYARGANDQAAEAFAMALAARAYGKPDPRIVLNLGHAQARDGQPAASATYARLLKGSSAELGSVARQQLAVLAAGKGEVAQALSLLRQALLLNPQNSGARYDFEVLSQYLAKKPNRPKITPPANANTPDQPKPAPDKDPKSADNTKAGEKAGTERKGEINDTKPAASPTTPPAPRPEANGQPDNRQPNATPGNAASGGRQPGTGATQPVASGNAPGTQRGLDRTSDSPNPSADGRSSRPGTEAATPADVRLQTQRERLQAMNLSPAQARQLLETLRAQEQQYLQQITRPATAKPDPSKPTW